MKKIKVLWVCNLVLPQFVNYYNIKARNTGGWMSSLYEKLNSMDLISISLCFPIYDESRRKDIHLVDFNIYSFDGTMDISSEDDIYIEDFCKIMRKENPDIVHIWGTEYQHAYYAVQAAKKLGIKVLIDIQGIISYIYKHYLDGISQDIINNFQIEKSSSLLKSEKERYLVQSDIEKKVFESVTYVTGRTQWDLACVKSINSRVKYFENHRMLRNEFYKNKAKWEYDKCEKHTIFLSNASYALKGAHLFLDVIKLLKNRYSDIKVIIAGKNPLVYDMEGKRTQYGEYLNYLIDNKDLANNIEFKGELTEAEMVEQLLKTNVFVASSTVENSCNSLCEAMMLGVPVVATYAGGMPSLIEHGNNGFLYQTNADYMGAYFIEQLFEDRKIIDNLSHNAILTAEKRHNSDFIIFKIAEIYRTVIEDEKF